MNENNNWIKMGFKICKTIILVIIVISVVWASRNVNKPTEIEKFSFNKSLDVTANVVKNSDEEKKEETSSKTTETTKKTDTSKNTTKETTKKATSKSTTKKSTTTKNSSTSVNSGSKLTGILTGYGADCPKCGGTLACKSSYKVKNNGVVTYPDKTYGNVRIVASSKSLKCGSIVKFNLSKVSKNPIYAIVLDRGVLGNNLDLLMASEKEANKKIGRNKITYEVLRTGW